MLRRTIASAYGLALTGAILGWIVVDTRAADPAGPRVEVETLEIDLGEISRGATVEARFRLRNVGDRDLHILEARPG